MLLGVGLGALGAGGARSGTHKPVCVKRVGRLTRSSPSSPSRSSLQPKTYVQGTSADQTSTGLNAIIGVGAAAIAVAALASGLFAIGGPSGIDSVAPPAELKSLSQYSSEFRG